MSSIAEMLKTAQAGMIWPELNNVAVVSAKGMETNTYGKTEQWCLLKDNVDGGETIGVKFVGHKEIKVGTKFSSLKSINGKHGMNGIKYWVGNNGKPGLNITGSAWLGYAQNAGNFNGKPRENNFKARSTGQSYTLEDIAALNKYFVAEYKDTIKDIIGVAILASKSAAQAGVMGLKADTVNKNVVKEAVNQTFGQAPSFNEPAQVDEAYEEAPPF
jgi:hypothetical protein